MRTKRWERQRDDKYLPSGWKEHDLRCAEIGACFGAGVEKARCWGNSREKSLWSERGPSTVFHHASSKPFSCKEKY